MEKMERKNKKTMFIVKIENMPVFSLVYKERSIEITF